MGHEMVAWVSGIGFHRVKTECPWSGIREILHLASKVNLCRPTEVDIKWALSTEHFLCFRHSPNCCISIILYNLQKSTANKWLCSYFTTEENTFRWFQLLGHEYSSLLYSVLPQTVLTQTSLSAWPNWTRFVHLLIAYLLSEVL